MTQETAQDDALIVEASAGRSKIRKIGAIAGWSIFFLGSLAFFTILKFPDARLKAFVQDTVNSALAPQGISLIARSSSLSILFGVKYEMEDVSLYFRNRDRTVKLERLSVSPSLLSLLTGGMSGSARLEEGEGDADLSFSMSGNEASLSFDVEGMDLSRMGVLPAIAGIKGGAIVEGYGEISGDLSNPATLSGDIHLKLNKIKIDEQRLPIFAIPEVAVSESEIRLRVRNGKASIQEFRLGKDSKDDLRGTLKGEVQLGRQLYSSNLKTTATLYLSERIRKAPGLSAIDLLLGAYRQTDGGYCLDLSGTMTMPGMASCRGKK